LRKTLLKNKTMLCLFFEKSFQYFPCEVFLKSKFSWFLNLVDSILKSLSWAFCHHLCYHQNNLNQLDSSSWSLLLHCKKKIVVVIKRLCVSWFVSFSEHEGKGSLGVCLVFIFIFCFHFLKNCFHFQKIRILKTCLVWLLVFYFQENKTLKMRFQKEMYFWICLKLHSLPPCFHFTQNEVHGFN